MPSGRGKILTSHATHTLSGANQKDCTSTNISLAPKGHPCAEDCGGEDGWEDLKELFAKPRMRDEDDKRQWYKTICLNGDPKGLNPYAWSILDVNDGLQLIKP